MSNINTDIAKAFLAGKARKIKETRTDGFTVFVGEKPICVRAHKHMLRISMTDRPTPANVSRLNAILHESQSGYILGGYWRWPNINKVGEEETMPMPRGEWLAVPLPEGKT